MLYLMMSGGVGNVVTGRLYFDRAFSKSIDTFVEEFRDISVHLIKDNSSTYETLRYLVMTIS